MKESQIKDCREKIEYSQSFIKGLNGEIEEYKSGSYLQKSIERLKQEIPEKIEEKQKKLEEYDSEIQSLAMDLEDLEG